MASFDSFRAWGRYFAAPIRKGWDAFIDLLMASTGQAIKGPYKWSTDITDTDPTAGYVKGNNASAALITELYVSDTNSDGTSESLMLSAIRSGDFLAISAQLDDDAMVFNATGDGVDHGGWWTIPVVYEDHTGGFIADEALFFALIIYSANTFLDLTDTPDVYAGATEFFVKVKSDLSGLEFVSDALAATFLDLTDTPDDYIGDGGKALYVKKDESVVQGD